MFKISIVSSVFFLVLAATAPAKAQIQEDNQAVNNSYNLSPRELVSSAHHGVFKAQGIPGYNNFGNGIRSGKITAEVLIESAIANNRLPEAALTNAEYLNAVDHRLKSGGCGSI